jgi:hypothetical protein
MYQIVELFKTVLNLEGSKIRIRINHALDKSTLAEVVELFGSYAININPCIKGRRKLVELIGHEMTHIKQFEHDALDLEKKCAKFMHDLDLMAAVESMHLCT